MNARTRLLTAAMTVLAACAALAQQPPTLLPPGARPPRPSAPAPAAPAPAPAIATVGTRRIAKAEFEQRANAALRQYRDRTREEVPEEMQPVVRRQVLETLIRRELLVLEAVRRGTLGTEAEAEAEVMKDPFFNPGGRFDAARYEAIKTSQPGNYANAIRQMREQIGARRLNERLEREHAPSMDEARAAAARALSTSDIRYLALPLADFGGRNAEPRESEVLDAYRRGAESYRRPARAVLTMIPVGTPDLPVSEASSPAAQDAWNRRMKASADSIVAALRSGAPLETLAEPYGGPRRNIVVMPQNFPGFWLGDARDVAAVFGGKPGDVLDPVRGRKGYLVVRVDEVRPSRIAPLAEVSREIRGGLRAAATAGGEDRVLRALYSEIGPALRGPAVRVRWAWVDTTRLQVPSPSAADLERFLRAHLADYSYFDPKTSSVRTRSLAEVEDEVRRRWIQERRDEMARAGIENIARAWRRGARDAAAERRVSGVREAGPLPPGAPLDSTLVGRVVADSVRARGAAPGVGEGRYLEGRVVFQIHGVVADHLPTFEQAVPALRERYAARLAAEEEAGARAIYDRDPARFALGPVVHFSRLQIPAPDVLDVPLTRAEVERYHREHLDRYSAPEEVVARHILLAPSGGGDAALAEARRRADAVLRRLRGGEDFATLARQLSDDTATRSNGGDLGPFGRGVMPDAVERAAFGAEVGDVVGPVQSEAGFHVIQVTDRLPAVAHPLATLWTVVGSEAAREKAERMNAARAESVFAAARTPAEFRALARKLGLVVVRTEHEVGDTRALPELRPVLEALGRMKPGEVYPSAFRVRGIGYAISWVDSIAPPRAPRWESARDRALEMYRNGSGRRAMEAKRAELDSMLAAGWSFDSLGTLWGGLGTVVHTRGGTGIPLLGGASILDSLITGRAGGAPLEPGVVTGWIEFPGGLARVRLDQRTPTDPAVVAARAETDRRAALERNLATFYEELKRRWPVRILDSRLAQVPLPPLPDPS